MGKIILGICLIALTACTAQMSSQTPAAKADPQVSMQQGLAAVAKKNWDEAIHAFSAAHNAAPEMPDPIYNLALAEAQVPGREVRAIVWFQAYLALRPDAPNAGSIHAGIKELDVRAQANVGKLINILSAMTTEDNWKACGTAYLAAASSDVARVQQANLNCPKTAYSQASLGPIDGFAKSGHFKEAINMADQLDRNESNFAYGKILSNAIDIGAFPDTQNLVDLTSSSSRKDSDLYFLTQDMLRLASAEYQAGKTEAGKTMLAQAERSIERLSGDYKGAATCYLAIGLERTEDHDAAESRYKQCLAGARPAPEPNDKMPFYHKLENLLIPAKTAFMMSHQQQASSLFKEAINDGLKGISTGEALHGISDIFRFELEAEDWNDAQDMMRNPPGDLSDNTYMDMSLLLKNQYYEARSGAARSALVKVIAKVGSSPVERSKAWSDYVTVALNEPIFLDFASAVREQDAPHKGDPAFLFDEVFRSFRPYVDRLAEIRLIAARVSG